MVNTYVISLGCPKNTVDTEHLLASLGVHITPVELATQADIVFVNTCGFIAPAVEESVETILEVLSDIEDAPKKPLFIVAGCLVGRYGEDTLAQDIPEVDLWLSNKSIATWGLRIQAMLPKVIPIHTTTRILSTQSYAWLKIAEGCSHACSFCTIPSIRGAYSSTPRDVLMKEAAQIVANGVKELVVVAQDTTQWGTDFSQKSTLLSLMQSLGEIDSLHWLRLMYLYPAGVTEQLLEGLAKIPSFIPYFDIPMQHAHPKILSTMGRPFAHNPWKIIERVRTFFPNAALRTSIIVGFPGETEEHFQTLLDFITEANFVHLGVFAYQNEEGTVASEMENQIPEEVKEERRSIIMEIQKNASEQYLQQYVGDTLEVLVDAPHTEWPGLYTGRAWFQAPESDGLTYISGDFDTTTVVGTLQQAEITESTIYDLVALV